MRYLCVLGLLLCATAVAAPVAAQSAGVSGTISDQSGGVLPGVSVTLLHRDQGWSRETITNDEGRYAFPILVPGRYSLKAVLSGFAPAEVSELVLNVGDEQSINIRLAIAGFGETVTVAAQITRVPTSPAVSTVVDRQFVSNLPLNGRSFQSLFELTPGVVITQTSFEEQGQFSVNGQRANANYLTVDGVSANVGASSTINMGQSAAGGLPGLTALGGTNNLVSVDALEEFRIHTSSYAPEFGRTPGAQISLVTRSGGSRYHGSVFEYFRHDALDANDWFANRAGLPKPKLRQNSFGAVLGGPVFPGQANKTFFFASYEGLRLRQPKTGVDAVPTLADRIAAAPGLRPFLDAYPLPNGGALGNGLAEFTATYSDPSKLDALSLRLDHRPTQNLSLFVRANFAPSETHERGGDFTLSTNSLVEKDTRTFTAGATATLGSRITNDLRLNYSVAQGASYFDVDDFGGGVRPAESLLFSGGADPNDALFSFGFFSGPQFLVGKNVDNRQRQVNAVNTLSLLQGSHQLKVGVDYRQMLPTNSPRSRDLFVFFNDVPSTVNDTVVYANISATDTLPMSLPNFSLFAQDTWSATKRLTLTYGLRWDVNPPPSARGGKELYTVEGFDDPSTLHLAPAGTKLWKTQWRDIAPRVGLAYRLLDGPARETVIRAGAGTFYDMLGHTFGGGVSLFPHSRMTELSGSFPFPPALVKPPAFTTEPPVIQMFAVDPAVVTPRVYQWNIALEQTLGPQTVTVSYLGAAGRRLLRQEQLNAPNADFGAVFVTRNSAESDYKAFQVQVQRRLTRGLQVLAAYTLAKSMDNASNDSTQNTPGDRIDPRADWGPSNFDVRHTFTSAVTYNLPAPEGPLAFLVRGWALDAVFRARSATPLNVVTSGNLFGVWGLLRADVVAGEPLYVEDPSAPGGRRLNRAAFALPAPGRQGTLGRNALRGFPMSQLDLAIRRQFRVTTQTQLQFRFEAFNALNTPNFANPMNRVTSGQFGVSRQMLGRGLGSGGMAGGFNPLYQLGGPRSMQLSARFSF